MKTKVALIALSLLTLVAIYVAYTGHAKSDLMRKDVVRLRHQLREVDKKFETVRIEASKLRHVLSTQRKKMPGAAVQTAEQKE